MVDSIDGAGLNGINAPNFCFLALDQFEVTRRWLILSKRGITMTSCRVSRNKVYTGTLVDVLLEDI